MFSIARRKIRNCGFFLAFGVCFVILTGWASSLNAAVNIDIRSAGVLQEGLDEVFYTAAIDDCTDLLILEVNAGDLQGVDADFDGATVISPSVAVYGNLTLTNGTVMTVPEADESTYYPLDIWVEQTMSIHGATVDVSGKGYPRGRTLGNLAYAFSGATDGSHASPGGHESAGSPDAYGD